MLREHRWLKIEEALGEQPFLEIRDLAKVLGVSDATVRRDLESLHNEGRLKRTRGGATLTEQSQTETTTESDVALENVPTFSLRTQLNAEAKEKIGRAAASLIENGDNILIAGGSTPYAAARYLRHRRVSVVTNSLPTAALLGETLGVDVLVTGGLVYPRHNILIGPQLKQTLQGVRAADWLFIGGSGATSEGFFDSNYLEVEAQRELMARANRVALLLDSTKFEKRDMILVAAWDEIDVLVTDTQPPKEWQDVLKRAGVRIVLES